MKEELKTRLEKWIELEISELNMPLDEIITEVEDQYPDYKFYCVEPRYESCVIVRFEHR